MEDAYAGLCSQSVFEPKMDFTLCINKSIKLFLKDINISKYDKNNVDNKNDVNTSDTKIIETSNDQNQNYQDDHNDQNNQNDQQSDILNNQHLLKENEAFLNGYLYFSRIGHNINLLLNELSSIKKDFKYLNKETRKKIKKFKQVKNKNIIYKDLLQDIKEKRKRKEIYEKLSIEIKKLDEVKKVQDKQKIEKDEINNLEHKILNIENIIKSNNDHIQETINQINKIVSENIQI
ncbi:conserved Plasmodium protein, unknown function [Plasmodium reichenowi]|uniref:Uncharacterized protein n=1 Tax=Plasmodium reichenowi TaxID=5854 RepID=A0A060RPN9_PLARE|nr:hypothetical protein PRSY57_0615000 [Plasmodium reichenowi]KYO01048.1 hypothetical protein PRSY57_0615000 [Plasmodium reichenowi]CDO63352.1 conserved Plasmodium protein, unknown function [Plasmodium reichenowi]